MLPRRISSLYSPTLDGKRECHLSVDQKPHVSVSIGCWDYVLPARLRELFTSFHQLGIWVFGFSLFWSLLWVLLGWGLLAVVVFVFSGLWQREHAVRMARLFGGGRFQYCFRCLTGGTGKTWSDHENCFFVMNMVGTCPIPQLKLDSPVFLATTRSWH